MYNPNYLKIFGICAGIVTSTLSFGYSLANPLRVESSSEYLVSLEFPPAPNRKPPQSTSAGAVRGRDCIYAEGQPLMGDGEPLNRLVVLMPYMALTPSQDNQPQAKTFSSQPNFFFYIPRTKATSAQFMIEDERGKKVEVQQIQLSDTPGMIAGIIKVSPSKENGLEIGKKYRWEFNLSCSDEKEIHINKGTKIEGQIERVNLDPQIQSSLKTATSALASAEIYARAQLWPETLDTIIQSGLRTNQFEEWEQLLQSVGLQDFALQPLLNCCQPKNNR
jgi:hypothetical protein